MSLKLVPFEERRKEDRRKKIHPGARTSLAVKQVATIHCLLRRQPGAIVEIPRGLQLQVTYGGENDEPNDVHVTTASAEHTGKVKSGSDWVLVRNDGVIEVDARVTIQFTSKILMDMTLKGTIDLTQTFGASTGQDAYEKYKAGTYDPVQKDDAGRFFHRMVGSARFEGGEGPVDSDYADFFTAAPFGTKKDIGVLMREQFFTTGSILVRKVPHYDPTEINLVLWSWQP